MDDLLTALDAIWKLSVSVVAVAASFRASKNAEKLQKLTDQLRCAVDGRDGLGSAQSGPCGPGD